MLVALVRAFAHGQIEWAYVGRFLTVPVILSGIVNTIVMAVLAMALGIVLGVVVAIMRLSPNPVLAVAAAGYTWLFRGTPADPATAAVVQPGAGVSRPSAFPACGRAARSTS